MNECSGGFFHAHTTSCLCCYVTLQELFYWFMKYEIWSYVEMSANWSSLHVNYKPGWERLIAQPRTSQRGNQYKTRFVFELEKVQDVQTNYTKRINSAKVSLWSEKRYSSQTFHTNSTNENWSGVLERDDVNAAWSLSKGRSVFVLDELPY